MANYMNLNGYLLLRDVKMVTIIKNSFCYVNELIKMAAKCVFMIVINKFWAYLQEALKSIPIKKS